MSDNFARALSLGMPLQARLERLADSCAERSTTVLRLALGIVFLWFGALKLVPGFSPAEALAGKTILALTLGLVKPAVSVPLLGVLECCIGSLLLTGRHLKVALFLLMFQMAGTLTPLALFPHDTFAVFPVEPTLLGQYIIKNLVLIAGGLVLASGQRRSG